MYAKTLVPGPLAVPSLTATTSEADVVMPQLLGHGWGEFGPAPPRPGSSRLLISHERLQLVVEGQALLDDLDPSAPDGWWRAVDGLDGHCVVIVLRTGDVDLGRADAGSRMRTLMEQPGRGVWAVIPIEHPATGNGR